MSDQASMFIIYLVCECIAFAGMLFGLSSGLVTLHRNRIMFGGFDFRHVLQLRMDAIFYMVVVFSTSLCLIDIVLRITWMSCVGWRELSLVWRILFLVVVHGGFGAFSALIHMTVDRLLRKQEICALCQRKL